MKKQRWKKMEVKALITEFNMKYGVLNSMLDVDMMEYVNDCIDIQEMIDRKTF